MNPPAAIQNAMARERKPFTYTPGGLDLSEIKSERMARRLMRNAMNQGVPELPASSVQSPTSTTPGLPSANYHNLPVQVFPDFQLPANPKSLLRTRSTPQPKEPSVDRQNGHERLLPEFIKESSPFQRRNSSEFAPNAELVFPSAQTMMPPPPMTIPNKAPRLTSDTWIDRTEDRITPSIITEPCLRMPSEILQSNTEEKKTKSKKKTAKDGEDTTEVEAFIKITKPKKTISTSVEIDRKFLPDGRVEETKTTTTNTIINGKVEDTKVNKETRILSDEEAKAVIQEGSEEEEEEEEEEEVKKENHKNVIANSKIIVQQNGHQEINVTETRTETKNVRDNGEVENDVKNHIESNKKEEIEDEIEEEEEEEEYEEEVVTEKTRVVEAEPEAKDSMNSELVEEEEEEEELEKEQVKRKVTKKEEKEVEAEEMTEIVEEKVENSTIEETVSEVKQPNVASEESETEEEEEEEEEEEVVEKVERKEPEAKIEQQQSEATPPETSEKAPAVEPNSQGKEQSIEIHIQKSTSNKENVQTKTETSETKTETITSTPIPEVHTTTKKETTEISSTLSDTPYVSTQTELHRVENVETINKTTRTLDNAYDQITQQGVPTVKTYFAPNRERVSISPSKPYTPTYSAPPRTPTTETRHSLLLDRLSTERQFAPPESYHNISNQSYATVSNQWAPEPQSEIVIANNVKPSSINNSQWYQQQQQSQASSNFIYNNVKPTTPAPQPMYQQMSYDNSYSTPVYNPEPQSYVPKPSTWGSDNLGNLDRVPSINAQSKQYSFMSNKTSDESYTQKNTDTQQFSSGYVPPPWETEKITSYYPSPYYDPPQSAPILTDNSAPAWSPHPQRSYNKPTHSYQPPAPNASFVKNASPAPKSLPGRKTYYSECERRYISVPESMYIPTETKIQPQWNASPQYYYDNPEPMEQVEPTWRKELREFTEKSTNQESTTVQPPWKDEANETTYSSQPAYSQTMRPQSWREMSYETESLQQSQEWPRVQTRRPISAYVNKSHFDTQTTQRTRGVSVDRYNSNTYQPPSDHTPSARNGCAFSWESQEQNSVKKQTSQKLQSASSYHNPNVPAYHVRPTESRDYQVSYAPRWSGQGREIPVQSRSFKYLQMLTGTEDGVEEPEPFREVQPHHAMPKPRRV